MTKLNNEKKEIKKVVKLGEKNKILISEVKNWCEHLNIEDISGGLIAEMYHLPINLRISCSNASQGLEGMNFEWVATEFILGNCLTCKFHKEITKENFGNTVIDKLHKRRDEAKKIHEEENAKKQILKDEVNKLIEKEKSQGEITILSILTLIKSLDEHADQNTQAEKILESSKLSPKFFDDVALDSLSLFFEDTKFGDKLLQATENILNNGSVLPDFAFNRLTATIEKGRNLDTAVGVFRIAILNKKISDYYSLIDSIIYSLQYGLQVGFPHYRRPSYPNTIKFLKYVHDREPQHLNETINKYLEINNKINRININFLLQELIPVKLEIVTPHIIAIIKSIELDDDRYNESADRITCKTLSEIYKQTPEVVLSEINKIYPRLSLGAKVELIDFFEIVLSNNELVSQYEEPTKEIVIKLLDVILSKEIEHDLTEKIVPTISRISRRSPLLFSNHIDSLVLFLTRQVEALSSFHWYLKELDKPKDKAITFNPLIGKDYLTIHAQELDINKIIRQVEMVLVNIISHDKTSKLYLKILDVISNLNSSTEGHFKSILISVIRKSVNNPIYLAEILPNIYKFLYDIDSKQVRNEGLNFVVKIIDEYDHLITQNLIDTIKIFLSDVEIGIKGKAIEAYGSIIKKFPQYIEEEQVRLILQSIIDPYVVIHKSAAKLSYKIFPYLTAQQKIELINGIIILEDTYFREKDFEYCKELVDILLFVTKGNNKLYLLTVNNYVVKYCNLKEEYMETHFIAKLTQIRDQSSEFNELWLQQVIGYLSRTYPDYYNSTFDERKELFLTIFKLPGELIVRNLENIVALAKKKIDEHHLGDVIELYSILGYFNLHSAIIDLTQYFKTNIEQNKSNEFIININDNCERKAVIEIAVTNQNINEAFINSIN